MLHLDVMDGHFVPNITFGPKMVRDIDAITDLRLDVHLMISEPEKYISDFAKAGADWISVHYEAADDLRGAERRSNPQHQRLNRLIHQVKDSGCKAGAVIKPETPVDVLDEILGSTDYVLIMSVSPGFGGQKFIESSLEKARTLRNKLSELGSKAFIEMDGGIGLENIAKVRDAGVDVFVCGNSIFGSKDKAKTIKEMKRIINQ